MSRSLKALEGTRGTSSTRWRQVYFPKEISRCRCLDTRRSLTSWQELPSFEISQVNTRGRLSVKHCERLRTISVSVIRLIGLVLAVCFLSNSGITHAADSEGMSPLMEAVRTANESRITSLLSKGARINDKDRNGKTVLMWACGTGPMFIKPDPMAQEQELRRVDNAHAEVVKMLLKKGAKVSEKDKSGQTALMWAVRENCLQVTRVLLENGAKINESDKTGYTPLIIAAQHAKPELIKLLIEKGADINAKTRKGDTALSEARNLGYKGIEKMLGKKTSGEEQNDPVGTSSNSASLPKYTIYKEDVAESPLKAQVDLEVIVSNFSSEDQLRQLMSKLYDYAKAKHGFKHFHAPTSIYISIFRSEEHAKSGEAQHLLRLIKGKNDSQPLILVNESQMSASKIKPGIRFGLSEKHRISIWQNLYKFEDKVSDEAEQKYRDRTSDAREKFTKKKISEYESRIASKYSLTRDELDQIQREGRKKDWPRPE